MTVRIASYFFTVLFFFVAVAHASPREEKKYSIVNNAGDSIGSISLQQGTKGIVITIDAERLPPGYHGMHFHEIADCSDKKAFASAGGHVDPHKKPHGFFHPEGPHEGNLPNLIVPENGRVQVELYSSLVQLREGDAKLLDDNGSALIIHTSRDDHVTQPIGGAGGRIACAEIK